jgi:hypothetical protein
MNYCKGFVKDVVERILKEPSGCCSCDTRKRLCKNFAADYTHFGEDVDVWTLVTDFEFLKYHETMYPNIVLTYLHNWNKIVPTKEDLQHFITYVQWFVRMHGLSLSDHMACLNDNVPNYLICISNSPRSICVKVYDDVWDYYKNRTHSEFEFESGDIERMYFRDWIKSFE